MDDNILFEKHMSRLAKNLNNLRFNSQLFDFKVCVGGIEIPVHKVILAANSDYFSAMFACNSIELESGRVVLQKIDPAAVQAIIEFFYTSKITLSEENIQDTLLVASRLQVDIVLDLCIEFVEERIDITNCCGIANLAEHCNLHKLYEKAFNFCLEEFMRVVVEKEFLELDCPTLIQLISHDDLNVEKEMDVFQAAVRWINYDKEKRNVYVDEIMCHVRYAFMEPPQLVSLSSHDLIQSSKTCREIIDDAKNYLLLKDHPEQREKYFKRLNINSRNSSWSKQCVYAVGGWTDEFRSIASAEVYNPINNTWTEIEPMTQKRCGVGLTTLGRSIYAVGGHDGQNYLNSVERYDVERRKWFKDVKNMNYVRTSVGVVTLGGYIYAIGGQISVGSTDKVERYDPITNTWTECASLLSKRLGMGVAVHDQKIYVMGGSDSGHILDSVERYFPYADKWVFVRPMNIPRKHLGSCLCNGMIYAVGGRSNDGELDIVELYDPKLDTWTIIRSMNLKRCGIGLVELAGRVYAIGGQMRDARLHDVEAYDPIEKIWRKKRPMIHGRLGGGMAVYPAREF